jgi:hypothetical protein
VIERRIEAEARELEAARSLTDTLDHTTVERVVA